ncbi:MAG: hypothetical protein EP335_14165 [Alphaproteobacteria bacterium]|nr:MAG: hypothetical protein EP335_14165 [Alphaproteobacteria bacterium]
MRPRAILLSGVTRKNRHEILSATDEAVSRAGGWVSGHSLFSNRAVTIQCMLDGEDLPPFRDLLLAAGVTLDRESLDRITTAASDGQTGERRVAVNLTFLHDEPDLRHEIPAVPG